METARTACVTAGCAYMSVSVCVYMRVCVRAHVVSARFVRLFDWEPVSGFFMWGCETLKMIR